MKKIIVIVCLFNSLFIYSQSDTDFIYNVKEISEQEEDKINGVKEFRSDKLTLIYETFDVQVSYTKDVITLKAFDLYPELKKVTKIKQVTIFNAEEKDVVTKKFNSTEAVINVKEFPLGAYSVYVKTDNGSVTKQFIIE